MKKEIEITKIFILTTGHGPDKVFLYTTMPTTMPNVTQQPLQLDFQVVAGGGRSYCEQHFSGIPIEEVNL